MNGLDSISTLESLARRATVLGCCVICTALLGAVAKPANAPAAKVESKVTKTAAGAELMHDIPAAASGDGATLAAATIPGLERSHKKVIWLEVTAYCGCKKCCGPHAQGLTASGRTVAYNGGQFVAADTRLFKFGTLLQIPGYAGGQSVEVIDRGGAIKGPHIDVFFSTHAQALEWGRKWLPVTVDE